MSTSEDYCVVCQELGHVLSEECIARNSTARERSDQQVEKRFRINPEELKTLKKDKVWLMRSLQNLIVNKQNLETKIIAQGKEMEMIRQQLAQSEEEAKTYQAMLLQSAAARNIQENLENNIDTFKKHVEDLERTKTELNNAVTAAANNHRNAMDSLRKDTDAELNKLKKELKYVEEDKKKMETEVSLQQQQRYIEKVELLQADRQDSNQHDEVKYQCDQCGSIFTLYRYLTRHKQSKHIMRYKCDKCASNFSDSSSLSRHKQSKHEGVRYECDKCDYKATHKSSLTKHKKSIHEGVRYECDKCDYKATWKETLNAHKLSKHDGVKYECDQCDHKATRQGELTRHKQSKHEGVRYKCDHCHYEATGKGNLTKHKQSQHE